MSHSVIRINGGTLEKSYFGIQRIAKTRNPLEIKYSDVYSVQVDQKSRHKRFVTKRLRILIPEYNQSNAHLVFCLISHQQALFLPFITGYTIT